MQPISLSDIRARVPSLAGLGDEEVLDALANRFGVDKFTVAEAVGYQPKPTTGQSVADSALSLASAVTSGVQMLANVAGANNPVSETLGNATEAMRARRSFYKRSMEAARAQKIAEAEASGSLAQEVGANVGAFFEQPLDMTLNALGTSLPTLATMLIPGAGPAAVAARVGAAGAMGAAQGAGAVKGSIYERVKQAHLDAGLDPAAAEARAVEAQAYGESPGNIAVGAGLGVLAGTTGAEGVVARIIGREAGKNVERGLLKSAGVGALKEAPMEAAQGGQERIAANMALQSEGFDVPTMQGVAGQAALEGMASMPVGAGFGMLDRGQPPAPSPAPAPAPAPAPDPIISATESIMQADSVEAAVAAASQALEAPTPVERGRDLLMGNAAAQNASFLDIARQSMAQQTLSGASVAGALDGQSGSAANTALLGAAQVNQESRRQGELSDLAMAGMERQAQRDLDAQRDRRMPVISPVADEVSKAIAASDILNPRTKQPFKTEAGALNAARGVPGGQIVEVQGGFVVRPAAGGSTNVGTGTAIPPVAAGADRSGGNQPGAGLGTGLGLRAEPKSAVPAQRPEDQRAGSPVPLGQAAGGQPAAGAALSVEGFIAAPNGYRVRISRHQRGSNVLDPAADFGAFVYELRKGYDDSNPLTMVVSKGGKLVAAKDALTDNASNGIAWVPQSEQSAAEVAGLLAERAQTAVGSPERKAVDAKIAEAVAADQAGGRSAPAGDKPAEPQQAESDAQAFREQERAAAQKAAKVRKERRARLQRRAWGKNPLMTFLASHGVALKLANEFLPDKQERKRKTMVEGYGPIFRRTGLELDVLAQRAVEDGFLVTDDAAAMHDLIVRGFAGERIIPMGNAMEVDRVMQARAQAAFEDFLAQQQAAESDPLVPDDILEDIGYDEASPEVKAEFRALMDMAATFGIDTDTIIDDASRRTQDATETDYYRAAIGALQEAIAGSDADGRVGPGQDGGTQEGPAEGLTAPTREDILAQQDRLEQADELDQREQVQREADSFQLQQQTQDNRRDTTGDMFGGPSVDDLQAAAQRERERTATAPSGPDLLSQPEQETAAAPAAAPQRQPAQEADEPALTEAQARERFEWRNLGTKDNEERHGLYFDGMRYGYVTRLKGTPNFEVDDGERQKSLRLAKQESERLAIERLKRDGYITRETAATDQAQAPGGDRFEAGKALTKEQRKRVLDSLVDVYRAKGAPREQKGIGRDGNERYGYVHSPELFEKSDITGAMVRYYVTLPDGRRAHPTELFPDYTQSDIDAEMSAREQRKRDRGSDVQRATVPAQQFSTLKEAADWWDKRSRESTRTASGQPTIYPSDERQALTDGNKFIMVPANTSGELMEAFADAGWRASSKGQPQVAGAATDAQQAATSASAKAGPTTIQNFGDELPPARRNMAAKLTEDLADEDIAKRPFSEIWPLAENEAIEDTFAAAVAHAARAEVPAKPRQPYKLRQYIEKVKMLRGLAGRIVSGEVTRERMGALIETQFTRLYDWWAKVQLLETLPRDQWKRIETVEERPDAFTYDDDKQVPAPMVRIRVDGRSHWLTGDMGVEGAARGTVAGNRAGVMALLGAAEPEARMKFEIRQNTKTGEVFINKEGDKERRRLMTFATVEEARLAIKDQYGSLVGAWEAVKARDNITERDLRNAENRPRVGKDHRDGKDVTVEQFQDRFGFRGGEFGKWVQQGKGEKERQALLNSTYDALMDLADLLNLPPRAMSLNGTLGIALGSRGGGWASAHFEPSNLVINLTKTRGAGALAHEWFHALDNYFSRLRRDGAEAPFTGSQTQYRDENFITHRPEAMMVRKDRARGFQPLTQSQLEARRERHKSGVRAGWPPADAYDADKWERDPSTPYMVRPEVEAKFVALVNALKDSPMTKRAALLDNGNGYWSRTLELAARAFEGYVIARMHEQGYHNDFLVNVRKSDEMGVKDAARYPYLLAGEVKPIADAFDALFGEIQTREDDAGNVAMFSRSPATQSIYEARIDALFAGGKAQSGTRVLDRSDLMGLLGYPDSPVILAESHLIDGMTNHPEMTKEVWKKVPQWLDNPAAAYRNPTATHPDRIVVLVPETVAGYPVVLVIDPQAGDPKTKGGKGPVQLLVTAYAKTTGMVPLARSARDGSLLYLAKENAQQAGRNGGVQFPTHDDLSTGRTRILSEKDLAGWRRANQPMASRGGSTGMPKSAVQSAVDELKAKWANAPDVEVLGSMDDAPEPVRAEWMRQNSQGASGDIEGFHWRGKVYLVASALGTDSDTARVLFHEALGHYGLRGVFGKLLNPILRQVGNARPKEMAAKAEQYGLAITIEDARAAIRKEQPSLRGDAFEAAAQKRMDEDRLTAAEELLAEVAQARPELGIVKRAIAAIRTWLRDNIPGMQSLALTDDEIVRSFILPARGFVERGRAGPDAIAAALAFSRSYEAPVWYSELTRRVEKADMRAAPASAWLAWLKGLEQKGVKPDEIEWSGVREWLGLQQGKVTREAVLDYLKANGVQVQETTLRDEGRLLDSDGQPIDDGIGGHVMRGKPTKYGHYTLPGGENYREILLTLPTGGPATLEAMSDAELRALILRNDDNADVDGVSRADLLAMISSMELGSADLAKLTGKNAAQYKSGHWDQPNVLAHIRVNDRTDADGKRVLFVEELQSDWGQAAKKRGMEPRSQANPTDDEVREFFGLREGADPAEYRQEMVDALQRRDRAGTVPRAPFIDKTDKWLTLALKRVIKMAVDEGYDRVAFISGDQSAERYDLSKQVKRISWIDDPNRGDRIVTIKPERGPDIDLRVADDGSVGGINFRAGAGGDFADKKLTDVIGKDLAEKVLATKSGALSGMDLKVGGEGMRSFYDTIVPAAVKGLLKKVGGDGLQDVAIGSSRLEVLERDDGFIIFDKQEKTFYRGGSSGRPWVDYPANAKVYLSKRTAEKAVAEVGGVQVAQPGFDITPAMREKLADGMPLFSRSRSSGTNDAVPESAGASGNTGAFDAGNPDIRFSRTTDMASAARNAFADLSASSKTFNWWNRTIGTQYQKAQQDRHFKRAFDATQDYILDISRLANDSADRARDILPRLENLRDVIKDTPLDKDRTTEADLRAMGNAIWTGTLNDQRVYRPAELKSRFGLTDKQVGLYQQFRAAVDKSLDDLTTTIVAKMLRNAGIPNYLVRDELEAGDHAAIARLAGEWVKQDPGMVNLANQLGEVSDRAKRLKAEGYAPLMRFGQHAVSVRGDGGDLQEFYLFETEFQANRKMRELQAAGKTAERSVMSTQDYKLLKGVSPESLELFGDLLEKAGVFDPRDEVFQQYIRNAIDQRSAMRRMLERQGYPGYSTDLRRVLASFITSNARLASKNLHFTTMLEAVENIPKSKGDVRDEATNLVQYVQEPVEEAAKIRSFLFAQYIGGSVASALVNMTQSITMTLPYLSQFSSPARAGAALLGAVRKAATGAGMDDDLKAAIARAEQSGVVSPQEIHHLNAEAMATFGSNPLVQKAMFVWGSLFSVAEQFNRRAAFIAAYSMAPNKAKAYEFAVQAVEETQGIYSRANRPNWARGPIGSVVMTFKQFSIAYLEFLTRLPNREKALALAILALAAGAEGLPFADDLDDVIDTIAQRMGYAFNSKEEKRKFVSSVIGQGGAEFVFKGISSLPLMPIDISARMGLANLLPGTGIMRKDIENKARDVFEILGPAGGVVQDATSKTWMPTSVGDLGDTAWAPKAIRDLGKSIDMFQTGMYRDSNGRRVVDVDAVDAAWKAIGFNPAVVAREGLRTRIVQQNVRLAREVEGEIAAAMAEARFLGDQEALQKARDQLREWNEKNPDTPIRIDQRQIVQRIRKMRETRAQRVTESAPRELRQAVREAVQ